MMMNLALPSFIILSLIVLLLYMYISVYIVSAIKPYERFGDVDHTIKELMSF
jgi:hypothetical protein